MMVKRKLDGAVDRSLADRKIRKSDATVRNLWKIWRPAPSGTRSYGRLAGRQAGWLTKFGRGLKYWKLAVDRNIRFSALFSWGTALFQQIWCISNAFSRQTFLQGCFIKCEISRSPMISYRSLLYSNYRYCMIIHIYIYHIQKYAVTGAYL